MTTQEKQLENKNQNGRNWLLLIAGLGLLALIAVLFIGGFDPAAENAAPAALTAVASVPAQVSLPSAGPPLQAGDLPYDCTLQDLAGKQYSLHEFIGQPRIIYYWGTWCGPCRIEMPHLQNTFEARQADGLALLALNQDETVPEVEAFFDEFGLTFTPLLDEGGRTSENYGVGRILPTTFFINAAGEITAVHRGPMTQGQIDGYLAETIPAS